MQVSGHIVTKEGKKVYALGGKWNEYLDAQRCDEEGDPLPDAKTLHLWKVRLLMCLLTAPAFVSAEQNGLVSGDRALPGRHVYANNETLTLEPQWRSSPS